ncbi:methionine--tRNA ligase [Methanospirillum stamsii]|uniref:Methionine--tRNA ligase n=1 Tax=Methanospirillum stamsii TaxID=1277351 RepID=A0A2V2N6I2_9EURY|nr:methionine--tRNA ligase [Methanospirillum stamsii]PWR75694.1 methionine--tRNA ligase [Methanospirillum stamsii]
MNSRPLLVTCGLPYTNGPCHLGHLRTYVPADFYVRFMRHSGEEVVFICGSDNHGTPIVVSAEKEGITPRLLSERYHTHFAETFKKMQVKFDHFGMTDDPATHARAKHLVGRLIDRGYVYPKVIQQAYCTKCQKFLPDRYLEGICPYCKKPARGDECDQGCGKHLEPGEILEPTCKICGSRAEYREQEHFFFKLSGFHDWLKNYLGELKGTDNAINYAMGWVNEDLHDWCITRTLDWGVKFPGHDNLVVYVWVDAPIGYIAFTEEWAAQAGKDWKDYWCGENTRVTHFIGQDITYHHCIFWPAMLQGAGYGIPHAVVASGMLKIDDHKFSKSRGYVVWTNEDYLDQGLPADYLRYYMLTYTSHTKEMNFSWQLFQERVNNEVVNNLGNFIYRSLHLSHKQFGGVPEGTVEEEIKTRIHETIKTVTSLVESFDFKGAVDSILLLSAWGNTYIQSKEPWKLAKTDPIAMAQVMCNCLHLAKALVLMIEPVMPERASLIWGQLGQSEEISNANFEDLNNNLTPGSLPAPSIVFTKIDDKMTADFDCRLRERVDALDAEKKPQTPHISIDEFAKVEMKTGKVLSAEPVPKSSKLLKLQVSLGDEVRQIVSGIAQFHKPEDLVGKDVVVCTNLKPAKIFGIESNGMILAAGDEASLLTPISPVSPGTKIR